jgi:hypothetical protein
MQQENFEPGITSASVMHHQLLNQDDMLFLEVFTEMFKNELDNILRSIQFFKFQSLNFNDPYYSEKKAIILNLINVNFSNDIQLLNQLKDKLVILLKYIFEIFKKFALKSLFH